MKLRLVILCVIFFIVCLATLRYLNVTPSNIDTSAVVVPETEETPRFAGHDRCSECHSEIHDLHMQTSHAKTFALTKDSAFAADICGEVISAGDGRGDFVYKCDAEGLAVASPRRFGNRLFPLEFSLGSGKHAVTFVTLLPDADETVLVEHRYSAFADGSFRVTPGQEDEVPDTPMSIFGKVFRDEDMHRCIGCHVTSGNIVKREIQNLRGGVNCESCHGPAADHVAAAEAGFEEEARNRIIKERSSSEEVAMCGSCHRMPDGIDAERLERYPNSLVRFQPVGLLQSRCYLESAGAMRCTTCHDPHSDVDSRSISVQEVTCRSCHGDSPGTSDCSDGHQTDCIDCHMPSIELLPGISFHDHWIRVRAKKKSAESPSVRAEKESRP